jgi:hypothetical protein
MQTAQIRISASPVAQVENELVQSLAVMTDIELSTSQGRALPPHIASTLRIVENRIEGGGERYDVVRLGQEGGLAVGQVILDFAHPCSDYRSTAGQVFAQLGRESCRREVG